MNIDELKYDQNGLIPAIVQDYRTGKVLILAYMNKESLQKSLDTGKATFFSRSRQKLWTKGETSGNFMEIIRIDYDCDEDALLVQVFPLGPACHTGNESCFYRNLYSDKERDLGNSQVFYDIEKTIGERINNPQDDSYTNYLLNEGIDKICKKVGEEATETIVAAKNHNKEEIAAEMGDLIYHLEVLLMDQGMDLQDICVELNKRQGKKSEIHTQDKSKRGEI